MVRRFQILIENYFQPGNPYLAELLMKCDGPGNMRGSQEMCLLCPHSQEALRDMYVPLNQEKGGHRSQ